MHVLVYLLHQVIKFAKFIGDFLCAVCKRGLLRNEGLIGGRRCGGSGHSGTRAHTGLKYFNTPSK